MMMIIIIMIIIIIILVYTKFSYVRYSKISNYIQISSNPTWLQSGFTLTKKKF